MSTQPSTDAVSSPTDAALRGPVRNLRVTFWGVQGSCPVFPRPQAVAEYARRVAVYTLAQAREDLARRLRAEGPAALAEEIRGGDLDPDHIDAFQRRIGLPSLPVYGGETTCIQVETSEGDVIFFDGGSGIRPAAREVVTHWPDGKPRVLHFFASHEHLDHRSGLPFSQFCFARPNPFTIHIYGSHGFLTAMDERFGVYSREIRRFTHLDDPLDYRMMSATFTGTELRDPEHRDWEHDGLTPAGQRLWEVRGVREPVRVGASTTVTAFDVYHGATRCLAYKLEHGGRSFVFCTDHELRHAGDVNDPRTAASLAAERRLRSHLMNADLAYLDGQYFRNEYDGRVGVGVAPAMPRLDWGHSCIEDCLDRAAECRVKHTRIGHHDPERDWAEQLKIDDELTRLTRGQPHRVHLARADDVIDL